MLSSRLSDNFILLDFMYDLDSYSNSGVVYANMSVEWSRIINNGKIFCREFLDELVYDYGAVSVAAGFCYCKGVHSWQTATGCAADVVFHDWVNEDKPPISLLWEIDQSDREYERLIGYAGTEFSCLAYKPDGSNRSALYDNIRSPNTTKPYFVNYGVGKQLRAKRKYTPHRPNKNWRRAKSEPVYHTRRSIRPQHIRVGEYFTFLDLCRNLNAFKDNINTVPPLSKIQSTYINVARMFAEVLDEIVRDYGMVSIVRGIEPRLPNYENNDLHRWLPSSTEHAIEIAVNKSMSRLVFEHKNVVGVSVSEDNDSVYYRIIISNFSPLKEWTSHT